MNHKILMFGGPGLLLPMIPLMVFSCARVDRVAQPVDQLNPLERSVFSVGWTHRLMQDIAPYRNRANLIQGAVPAIDVRGGRVFIGSADNHLYCLGTRTGEVLWRYDAGSAVRSEPLFMEDTQVVFFGTDNGQLLALGAADGEERWSFAAEGEITRRPVLAGEALYVSSADNTVQAIDWTNGESIWRYHHEGQAADFEVTGYAGVAVGERLVFTGFSDGTVAALDIYDGNIAWTRDLSEDITTRARVGGMPLMRDVDTTPVLGKRLVYVASYEAGIYALDKETGAVVWREPTKNVISLAGQGTTLVASRAGEGVLALESGTGRVLWRRPLGSATYYEPTISHDLVIVSDSQRGLTALEAADGSVVQRYRVGNGAGGSARLIGRTAFVLSSGGLLAAIFVH